MTAQSTKRWYVHLLRVLATVGAIMLVTLALDYLVFRLRRPAFGNVTVHRFYRVPLKNGKVEIQYDGDYNYECARSLFPHSGDKPCWYLSRKTEEWIDVQSGTPNNPHVF
jgi:hypothetical protein